MRVLMLGWELPPHNSGGLGVACLQMAKALAASGADIDFVLPFHSDEEYDFMNVVAAQKIKSTTQKKNRYFSTHTAYSSDKYSGTNAKEDDFWTTQQLAFERSVGRLVGTKQFDIIHAHDWLTFRAALLAKQVANIPLIVHIHSTERDRAGGNDGNPLVREIEATTVLLADRVVAVSQRIKDIIVEDYDIPPEKIDVVHNSIDSSYLEPLDENNAYKYLSSLKDNGWKVVANVGRLTIQKGLPHFLRAAAIVIEHRPNTIFLLVGSGEQRDELLEMAADLGIGDKVIFAGFQRGKKWRDAYAVADLFVMPSVSEPFGLTPLEAIAYGTPVLVSKQSGISEVLSNCLKVDFWDEHELANQITAGVTYKSLADELHSNAWHEYERMSWSNAADKLMAMYRKHQRAVA